MSRASNGLPKEYVDIMARQMQEIYQMGIINTNEYNNIFKDSTSMIRFVNGKNAKSIKVSSFYSTIAAYEHIFANEKLAAQRAILSRCNLNNYIEANIVYDKEKSDAEKNDMLSSIPLASGMVISGQKIIDRGEIVNDYTCRVLNSFDKEMKRRSSTQDEIMTTFIGQILFVLILVMMFTSYLTLFRKDYFEKPRSLTMLYTMITLFPILVSMMMKHNFFSVYIIPFAMAAIFVRVFMDSRTAFITHVTMIAYLCRSSEVSVRVHHCAVGIGTGGHLLAPRTVQAVADIHHSHTRHHIELHRLLGTTAHAGQPGVQHRPEHVHLFYYQRHLPAALLPDDVPHREDVWIHLQRDTLRAFQYQ